MTSAVPARQSYGRKRQAGRQAGKEGIQNRRSEPGKSTPLPVSVNAHLRYLSKGMRMAARGQSST